MGDLLLGKALFMSDLLIASPCISISRRYSKLRSLFSSIIRFQDHGYFVHQRFFCDLFEKLRGIARKPQEPVDLFGVDGEDKIIADKDKERVN